MTKRRWRERPGARERFPTIAKLIDADAVRLSFDHAGVSCPACGYVFNRGVSHVDATKVEELDHEIADTSPLAGCDAVGVCTRCTRILVMNDGRFRLLNEIEELMLSREERRAFELMRAVAREHTRDLS